MTQNLRRSQYITSYGPGAILEGQDGPKIIPSIEQSNVFGNGRSCSTFEITDLRLSQALLNGAGIVRLPSNAELGIPDQTPIYETKRFPTWSLCAKHQILYRKSSSDQSACPRCPQHSNTSDAWAQANRQAIRFVRACPDGHLDEIDWSYLVHVGSQCQPSYLIWRGTGGSLKNTNIVCPLCGQHINLGLAYSRSWPCSGRFPERENVSGGMPPSRPGCDKEARILQRGAANLRISEIVTSLTIPPRSTQLHRLLEMIPIRSAIVGLRPDSKSGLISILQNLVSGNLITQSILNEINNNFEEDTIISAISDSISSTLPANLHSLRTEEFRALRESATHGHPPQPSAQPGGPPQFEIIQNQVRTIPGPGGHLLRITPINRLRVVMVQKGYRRVPAGDPLNSTVVDCGFQMEGRNWYTGIEQFGEGIFIDLDIENRPENRLVLSGQDADTWMQAWNQPNLYTNNMLYNEDRNQLHPVFVWWHTLAHRLINALAVDSGYSSAAVRERIFIDVDESTGEGSGGILLYTAQPGGDGTLGGMIALVPAFEQVLNGALRTIDACSNDPLCNEEHFGPGKYNGAACYACSLVSETSCEHRNMRLDRNLLRTNLP